MPDRTLDPVKRRATVLRCVRRYRARKRAVREAAEHAKRQAKTVARREATRLKVSAWRARKAAEQAALDKIINGSWFAPSLDLAELTTSIAAEHHGDTDFAKTIVAGYERASRQAGLNVNRFTVANGTLKAMTQRVLFHEAHESGMSVLAALEHAKTAQFIPIGRSDVEQAVNRSERYANAYQRWGGNESEIINALKAALLGAKENHRGKETGTDGNS